MKSCHWIFLATGDLGIELLTKQTKMNLELPRNILNYLSWILKDTTQIPLLQMDWWMMMVTHPADESYPFPAVRSTARGCPNRWVSKQALNAAWFNGQVRSDYPLYPSVNRNVFFLSLSLSISLSLSLSSDLNNYHSNILNTAENHPNLNHYYIYITYFKYLQNRGKSPLFHFFNIPKSGKHPGTSPPWPDPNWWSRRRPGAWAHEPQPVVMKLIEMNGGSILL